MIDLVSDMDIAEIISSENGKPVTIAGILDELLLPVNDSNKRAVKAAVRRLVMERGLPIASSKKSPAGYLWCFEAAQREAGARMLVTQAVDMLKRARVLVKPHVIAELLGQQGFSFGPGQSSGNSTTGEAPLI